jgi:hypothetical protein
MGFGVCGLGVELRIDGENNAMIKAHVVMRRSS